MDVGQGDWRPEEPGDPAGEDQMAGVVAIIPARLGSTRFPRKVLHLYRGRPLLYYVWREVSRARRIDRVAVATDSREIVAAVREFGGEAVRTSARHRTGSDRAAEAAEKIGGRIIVNVQADNFGLTGAALDRVVARMEQDRTIEFATLAFPIGGAEDLADRNLVKVVASDREGRALWFSRWPIPLVRDAGARYRHLGHIGVYFFRRAALRRYAEWPRTAAERAESLEQLRILEHGGRMLVFETRARTVSVDAPPDVAKLDTLYR